MHEFVVVDYIKIRRATVSDAIAIAELHHAAVHQCGISFYPVEILDLWSPKPDERRIQRMRDSVVSPDEIVIVAEIDGVLGGFGTIVPAQEELRALYVRPDVAGRGLGSAMLSHLESLARDQGNENLNLKASLNAVDFYRKRGFAVVRSGSHRIAPDVEMACMEMRKSLS
jgi:putative acetyltransferase